MDTPTLNQLSQAFGYATLALKIGMHWYQVRFPDATNVRKMQVPAFTLGALSFLSMGNGLGTSQYGIASLRSAIRNTKWGTKHKITVIGSSIAAMAIASALNMKSFFKDILPFMTISIGAAADYTAQGRYQRLLFSTALAIVVASNALQKNWPMAFAELASLAFVSRSIIKNDFNNAAGIHKSRWKNLKAYLHGIFKNSATGASQEGQLPIEPGHKPTKEELNIQWTRFAETSPNPYFTPQPA